MMFKKYPFVKQTGIKDCGVSCLQMIIKYYQGFIGTRILQEMTKTTKNGTTNIINASDAIQYSYLNLHNKMKRDNFTENDLAEIAKALDCSVSVNFTMNDTGETL